MSKSGYRNAYPDRKPIFNANIATKEDGKIWHGDLDLVSDIEVLNQLAKNINKTIYVLSEMNARFGTEDNINFELAVWNSDQV